MMTPKDLLDTMLGYLGFVVDIEETTNTAAFTPANLTKVGYTTNPLTDVCDIAALADSSDLRDHAKRIKEHALAHLVGYAASRAAIETRFSFSGTSSVIVATFPSASACQGKCVAA